MANLTDMFFEAAATRPSSIAVLLSANGRVSPLTFLDLANRVRRCAVHLRSSGLKDGDRVVLQIADPLLDLIAFIALSGIGVGVYVPAQRSEREFHVISLLGIKSVVSTLGVNDFGLNIISLDACFGEPCQDGDSNFLMSGNGSSPWLVRSSSGTTGLPKIFVTTHDDAIFRRDRYYDAVPIGVDDCFFSFSSISFGAARQRIFYALSAGATVLLVKDSQFEVAIDNVMMMAVTHLYCVPMFLERLCEHAWRSRSASKPGFLFPRVRNIETSSSVVFPVLRNRVRELLNNNFEISYSVSEVGHISSTRKSSVSESGLNNIGMPVCGVEVKIFDSDMQEQPAGKAGLIAIRFTDRATEIACLADSGDWQTVTREGWFFPGDVGYFSESRNLVFLGRSDDMMIFNGVNIFPGEIEAAVQDHPSVRSVAAFSIFSRFNYQVPCIAVIPHDGFAIDGLMDFCRQKLGGHRPRFIFEMKTFPRNPMGKVRVDELRNMAMAKMFPGEK